MNSLLAARAQMIRTLKVKYGDEFEETALLSKLMAYCSKEAHSCVEKAAMIGFVKLRILEPDQNCRSVFCLLKRDMSVQKKKVTMYFWTISTMS